MITVLNGNHYISKGYTQDIETLSFVAKGKEEKKPLVENYGIYSKGRSQYSSYT